MLTAGVFSHGGVGGARSQRQLGHPAFAHIPLAARGAVSAVLGGEQPSYRLMGLRARNSAQRFGAVFSREGVSVESGSARVRFRLLGYGREGAIRIAGRVAPRVSANRVDYLRPGVDEWYANGPLGLEQGFDVSARPRAAGAPLTLALGLSGNVRARLVGSRLLLAGPAGSLRYGSLSASDARGHRVRSWLQLRGERLLIRVDDRHAAYPLRIDPLVQQAKLTASDGAAMDAFSAVAVSADTIAVGAPGHSVAGTDAQGAVYVFQKPASGWGHVTQSAQLTVANAPEGVSLGGSVAISGDTVFAGAPNRTVTNSKQGAVYVFVKPASGWKDATQTAELTASDGRESDQLGTAVAASGDTLVAASSDHTVGDNVDQGEGYVFVKPASGWENSNESAILTGGDGAARDFFGTSVAIAGDTVAIGAAEHKVGANAEQGSAYLYTKPAAGWGQGKIDSETTELTTTDGGAGDHLGSAVAISGDTVFAGAVQHHVGLNRQGAVYAFTKPSGGWNPESSDTAELTASDGAVDDVFGVSLAASGDSVLVGAPLHDVGPNPSQGAAYLFTRSGATWTSRHENEELTASGGAAGGDFGYRVGLAGNLAVAGSVETVAGNALQGAAYLFALPPAISLTSPADGATFTQDAVVPASFSCSAPAGATVTACTGPIPDASAIDTATLGQHTFTVTVSDSDGISATRTSRYTVVARASGPHPRPLRLTLSRVRQSAVVWRVGSAQPRTARRRLPVGTTFSFVLSGPARATLSFTGTSPGRMVHGRCVVQTFSHPRAPRCTRTSASGVLTLNGHAGQNRVRFEGRFAHASTLRPGRYGMLITARTAAGQRANASPLDFTIAK